MPPEAPQRDVSVDLARGLACVLMVQTHAFHGWVRPEFQGELWFRVTRWLGAFPLPGFLLLAGVSVALQLRGATSEGVSCVVVARRVANRGAELVAGGYATNLAWGLLDGARTLDTFLRVDVLHVIGASLVVVAGLLVLAGRRGDERRDLPNLAWLAAHAALVVILLCPWVTRAAHGVDGSWRYALGLLVDVKGVSTMPAIPLASWCLLGLSLGLWQTRDAASSQRGRREDRRMLTLIGLVELVTGAWITQALVANGEALSRASVTVWPNALEGVGRGVVLLAAGAWIFQWSAAETPLRRTARDALTHLGRASLWVYVLHVPFCYGRLAFGLRRGVSLWTALPCVLLLLLASYGVARALALRKARSRGAAALRSSF